MREAAAAFWMVLAISLYYAPEDAGRWFAKARTAYLAATTNQ